MNEEQKIKAEKIEGLINQGFSKFLWNIFSDIYSILKLPVNLVGLTLLTTVSILSLPILLQVKIPRWLKK